MPHALLVYPGVPSFLLGFPLRPRAGRQAGVDAAAGAADRGGDVPRRLGPAAGRPQRRPLEDADLAWADLVLTSTMVVQQRSLAEVIARCHAAGKPVAVGGPHPTSFATEISGADHFLLDEVEETFPRFLADWEAGRAAREYRPEGKPAVTTTPLPRFDLLDLSAYGSMALQFSRGCPFDCEFCDITKLFGRVPRTKSNEQMVAELDALHAPAGAGRSSWSTTTSSATRRRRCACCPRSPTGSGEHGYPFDLYTEASVNLARNEPLMDAMVGGRLLDGLPRHREPQPGGAAQDQEAPEHAARRRRLPVPRRARDPAARHGGHRRLHRRSRRRRPRGLRRPGRLHPARRDPDRHGRPA